MCSSGLLNADSVFSTNAMISCALLRRNRPSSVREIFRLPRRNSVFPSSSSSSIICRESVQEDGRLKSLVPTEKAERLDGEVYACLQQIEQAMTRGLSPGQLQMFMEYFPQSSRKEEAQNMIFALQDKLVMKEYLSAKMYYNLGNYLGNNYLSCVITAQNALKDYPYTNLREDLSILILRAKYEMAINSVDDKKPERYRETVDEYYAFKNEFPESKYLKDAERIFQESRKVLGE